MFEKHPLADCINCPLRDEPHVPSLIPLGPTRLVVVGEAPGKYETNTKIPFSGPSGKLLDRVLNHYGYDREEVLYTNVTLCRPSDNSSAPREAVRACRERLLHEVRASGAADVVTLGGQAAAALIDDPRTITRLRIGPPKPPTASLRNNSAVQRVIPTWHPAYCLRTADAFPSMVSDIGKLKETGRVWSPPDWRYYDDVASAREVIQELQRRTDRLVVDIEVGVEKDFSFSHPNDYDLLCVGLAYAPGKAVVIGTTPLSDKDVLADLRQLLSSKRLIAHNGKFDLAGLYPTLGALELWFDTMLASYVLDERPGNHGLKGLAVEKLGAPQYDDEIARYVAGGKSYANIPRELLYKYNAYDVACTWELYELFVPLLDNEAPWPYEDMPVKTLRDVHDFLVKASNQLMFMELNGIALDVKYQNELRGSFLSRIDNIEDKLDEIVSGGIERPDEEMTKKVIGRWTAHINPRSPKQVKEYINSQLTLGSAIDSTDKEVLKRLREMLYNRGLHETDLFKFLDALLEHRVQAKLYSTYVEGLIKRRGRGHRVYTTYMLHGTTSGRLASRNPNLQNIVRDKTIRKQFAVSKEGNVFVHCDYKQAEGRVITTLAQDPYLQSIFNDPDIDLFSELSNQLYGEGNWAKEERVRTKAFFYGIGYGREPYSIGLEFKMHPREAQQRYDDFMSLIPYVARWQANIKAQVLSGKDLVTPFGRRRRFMLITDENRKSVFNEAMSYLPQSTASDICLSAAIDLRPMLKPYRAFLRLTIHDALVAECPQERAEEVAALMQETMQAKGRLFTDYVPFPVDISMGTNWGEL